MATIAIPGPPPIDGIASLASLRTLGTGSHQAAAGNDSRFAASVTSIALSAPSIFTVSGSPVTGGTGTLAFAFNTQTANMVLAGPASGIAATPIFRALVAADIPSLSGTYLPLAGGTMTGAITLSGTQLGTYNLGGTYSLNGTPNIGATIGISSNNTFNIGDATHRLASLFTIAISAGASIGTFTGADGTYMTTTGGSAKVLVDDTLGAILQYNGTNGLRMGLFGVLTRRLQMFSNNIADVTYTYTDPPNGEPQHLWYSTLTAARVINLPSVSGTALGSYFVIGDSSGNCSASLTLTITAKGTDTINGGTTIVLNSAYASCIVYAADTGKWICLKPGAGSGTTTIAAAYTAGLSQTDSTINLNSTGLGLIFKDSSTPISTSLLKIVNNGSTISYLDVNKAGTSIGQAVSISGSPTLLTATGAAHTGLTLSTEAIDVNLNLARIVQFATGALTTQRAVVVQAPTYAFVGASTITSAATLAIPNAPTAGTNATITNAYALWVQAGAARFDGTLGIGTKSAYQLDISGTNTNNDLIQLRNTDVTKYTSFVFNDSSNTQQIAMGWGNSSVADTTARSLFQIYTGTNHFQLNQGASVISLFMSGTNGRLGINTNTPGAMLDVEARVRADGNNLTMLVAGAANTALNASQDLPGVNFNLAQIKTFVGGAKTLQREFQIQAPTYAATSTTTIADAATFATSAGPIAGTNVTITRTHDISLGTGKIHSGTTIALTSTIATSGSANMFALNAINAATTDHILAINVAGSERLTYRADRFFGNFSAVCGIYFNDVGTLQFYTGGVAMLLTSTSALLSAFDLTTSIGGSSNRFSQIWGRQHIGVENTVTFSTTPNFDPATGEHQRLTLTSSLTSWTVSSGQAAEILTITWIQDATGSRLSGTKPSNVKLTGGTFTLSTAPNAIDTLTLRWDVTSACWREIGRSLAQS